MTRSGPDAPLVQQDHCIAGDFAFLLAGHPRAVLARDLICPPRPGRAKRTTEDREHRPMEKILLTRAGHTALNDELKQLKSVERPAVIAAIAEAREHGDLSENAEYHAAREKQSFIEGRVKELEGILGLAEVIDTAKLSGTIKFGATIRLVDEDTDEEKTFQIVGEPEADLEQGKLNIKSPLARALIGKDEGDSVEVKTPGGEKSYEILSISFV
jgi:transcription elongation factor GreA